MKPITVCLVTMVVFASTYVVADSTEGCISACSRVPNVFRFTNTQSGTGYSSSFKQLLCSAKWSSYGDAQKAGIEATIPIYDIPVPLSVNWKNSKREEWQEKNCNKEERNADYSDALFTATFEVDPVVATTFAQCVKTVCTPQSLDCRLSETESSIIFEASWKRAPGEVDSAAPVVQNFVFENTSCKNIQDLKPGVSLVSNGSIGVLCKNNLDMAPVIGLITNRGSCWQATDITKNETHLSNRVVLDKDTTYATTRLVLEGDVDLITQGHDLTINVRTLVIKGSPRIRAYEGAASAHGAPGNPAGTVVIRAARVEGAGLTIENFGQNGANGNAGEKGQTGQERGAIARGYDWSPWQGCHGGHPGGQGGPGGTGQRGQAGGSGGAGGNVTLIVPSGVAGGVGERIAISSSIGGTGPARRDCGLSMTCGGNGGAGGPGGPGGDGAPGGNGAPGRGACGGQNPGPQGPQGLTGSAGSPGVPGMPGMILIREYKASSIL
jgi:hypothetical protein